MVLCSPPPIPPVGGIINRSEKTLKYLKKHCLAVMANSYIIDSPSPSNLTYLWGYGSLLGLVLVMQIITGVTLAMIMCSGHGIDLVNITICWGL